MSVSGNLPQLAALRMAVAKSFGAPLRTHYDFVALVTAIEKAQKDHISETTLERLWGYSTRGSGSFSERTLDVLACFAGYGSWADFCDKLRTQGGRESEELNPEGVIDASTLAEGDLLRLGWMPDRVVEVRCLGSSRFEVVSSLNSSLCPGDRFSCLSFQKGRELYLEKFERAAVRECGVISDVASVQEISDTAPCPHPTCYVVGQDHGLTMVEMAGHFGSPAGVAR